MSFVRVRMVFFTSLAAVGLSIVFGIVAMIVGVAENDSFNKAVLHSGLPTSLQNVAIENHVINPPTNIWSVIGAICMGVVIIGVPVAVIFGMWANKMVKAGAQAPPMFQRRSRTPRTPTGGAPTARISMASIETKFAQARDE